MERMQENVTVNTEAEMMEHSAKRTRAMNKSSTSWGLRIWKRFSPLQLLRFIRDKYVAGCVTVANSAHLNGVAKHAAMFQVPDDVLSRQSSRRNDEAYTIEALSRQSSRNEAQRQEKPITLNLLIADQPSRFFLSASPKRTSFQTVPELDKFKSRGVSNASISDLLPTSAVHRTELLKSPSKRVSASLESYKAGNPVKLRLQKNRRARSNSSGRFSTSDVPDMTTANPFMKLDTFGRSPGRMSVDLLSGRISPEFELVRSTSIVEDGELSYAGTRTSRRMKLPVIGLEELKRSKSRRANQPNPYSSYDSCFPPGSRGDREVHPSV